MAPGCYAPLSKESSEAEVAKKLVANEGEQVELTSSTDTCTYNSAAPSNQIPLPPNSPPPLPPFDEESDDDSDSDSDSESDDDDDEEADKSPSPLAAEVDSFEILEQTLLKQRRLAKLKNTDLRRKVLLKRTFDLVCEIMDAENGFNDDDDDVTPTTPKPEAPEPVSSGVELELHDHTKMSDDDENETPVVVVPQQPQPPQPGPAQVPRQVKKRRHSDEDEDDEEEDADDDPNTYFYEHMLNDQQLNYHRLLVCHSSPLDHESDLNIYSHRLAEAAEANNAKDAAMARTNHPRTAKRTKS